MTEHDTELALPECQHCKSTDCYQPDKPTCDTQLIAELKWENRQLRYTVAMYACHLKVDPDLRHNDGYKYGVTELSSQVGERLLAIHNAGSRNGVSYERARCQHILRDLRLHDAADSIDGRTYTIASGK